MPAEKHPAYKEELERCEYTLQYVEKSLDSAIVKKERIDSDVDRIKRHFNSDSSQDYIDLIINTTLQDSLALKLRNLKTALGKPYFARIDFKEKDKETPEKLYIGKMCLMREDDQEVIIIDWRAPIANIYYEGRLGNSSYECPDGSMEGTLMLKRQFSINGGNLQEIFDIDITTNDEFLQSYLGASADSRLKEIVSTIQVEQNRIIRSDMWTPLIVQGAAGSGKTTIALHRIAYLIYTYEKTFNPENFMIIAPTRFFLNYISEVLPELGVEKVKQSTFEDFAMELIGKKFKIKDANEKLTLFVDSNTSQDDVIQNNVIRKCSEFKASMEFKDILDDYIKTIEETYIPREDFKIGSKVVFKYDEINNLFLNAYKMWPIAQRLNEIKKHLTSRLKIRKESIINQLHDDCDRKIKHLKMTMEDSEERQELIIEAIDSKNETIDNIEKYSKKAVKEYIKKISKLSPFQYYKDFINSKALFDQIVENRVDKDLSSFTREYTAQTLKSGFIEIEDIAPIIYLKFCIHGMDEKIPVRHIVIDEAQDFSVFQLYVLKKIVKDSSFTILGDLCQGIHSYRGTKDWSNVMESVFYDRRSLFLTLEQSYRTTVEIMEAANKVIRKLEDNKLVEAKPVIRHGEKPQIIQKETLKAIAGDIIKRVGKLKSENFKSIAIICKTLDECKSMLSLLKKDCTDLTLLTGKDETYKGGMVIVPSYLAKGLEFDAVIIANGNKDEYTQDELDIKLLYVAITRALHRLYIYYHGDLSPLLEEV